MATILVVDDHIDTCTTLAKLIQFAGPHAFCAFSGPEALSVLRDVPIDLVILDIMMPGMSGLQVLEKIRENPQTKNIVVVIYSAVNGEMKQQALEKGANDFWSKSGAGALEIREKLRKWLPRDIV